MNYEVGRWVIPAAVLVWTLSEMGAGYSVAILATILLIFSFEFDAVEHYLLPVSGMQSPLPLPQTQVNCLQHTSAPID